MTRRTNDHSGGSLPDPAMLLANAERRSITLADLRVDPAFSCRAKIDGGRVRTMTEAVRAGGDLEPLVVAILGDVVTLIDGHHRYHALLVAGEGRSDVIVLPSETTAEEARWLAFWLHWKAAKPLTSRERREGFRAYVRAEKHLATKFGRVKTYRVISAELGVARSTLHGWMREDFPAIAARMGRDPEEDGRPAQAVTADVARLRVELEHHANQIAAIARGRHEVAEDARERLLRTLRELGDKRPLEEVLAAASDSYGF